MTLTADELLAGGALQHQVSIPAHILHPNGSSENEEKETPGQQTALLRPLTVRDIQLITKAAKDNDLLTSLLIVQKGLVEPALEQGQIASMHAGLVKFLVDKIQEVSGMSAARDTLSEVVQAPLSRACFILAKEFGWTPQEVSEMTIGQILLYLEMLNKGT
ncbi:MAG: hypothetical protein GY765_10800 [bacterium]|nr:hypothetical protein [bacterium]